jgi:hypothetical protein
MSTLKEIVIETEARPLADWLPLEESDEVVYLTRDGRIKFVVVPIDEGDAEILAMRKNDRLMAHVAESVERARKGQSKSLAQIKAQLKID